MQVVHDTNIDMSADRFCSDPSNVFIKHFNKQTIRDGFRIFYSLTLNFIV